MTKQGHSSKTIANYLLDRAWEQDNALTPMQLVKLVYLCHGWMFGLYGRPLTHDRIEAWRYGPVIPKLYHAIKKYRSDPVSSPIAHAESQANFDVHGRSVMDQVLDIYGDYSGVALSRLTHAEGTPWHQTWRPDSYGLAISNDLIQEHFATLASRESTS